MGTRGAYGFRINQTDKIAYSHFDSYPDSLGARIVRQLPDIVRRRDKVEAIDLVNGKSRPTPEQKERCAPYLDLNVGEQTDDDWYCLLRKAQGDLCAHIACGYMVDYSDFMADSVWCEWAYVVNLDENVLEVYRGFQKQPHEKGRYAGMELIPCNHGPQYYPVALVASYPFDSVTEEQITALPDELNSIADAVAPEPSVGG
jgi:hypothetical protein